MKNTLIVSILIVILGGIYFFTSSSIPQEKLDSFAQCIASKNITMYGAAWCSHCQREKNNFGSSFQYIPYVECPENEKLCLEKKIEGYPTWIDAQGTRYTGEQGLKGLEKISGCVLGE